MKLSTLLQKAGIQPSRPLSDDPDILSIVSDSRKVTPGALYVAIRGEGVDGHSFIPQALQGGAVCVIADLDSKDGNTSAELIRVLSSKKALGMIAAAFHDFPAKKLKVIGITGTSGKTTTTFLIESILREAGLRPGLIGTVEFRIDGRPYPSTHTTPGAVELQELLGQMVREGCRSVAMEVSSHALKQRRVDGTFFDGVGFTNLSRDHLDYHKDFEDYYESKKILFTEFMDFSIKAGKKPTLSIFLGSEYGKRLASELGQGGVTLDSSVKISHSGIEGKFDGVEIKSELLGRFNAENILLAVSICKRAGISESSIQKGIESIRVVPGRLERVSDPRTGRIILVDYAHKPDALEKAIEVIRDIRITGKKIITVVGCGGDRDKSKRPIMGEIACRLSDQVIFTSDNPRTEDPEIILKEIVAGCTQFQNFEVIQDRRSAIRHAIETSAQHDIVLIAGKGHEDYQIIGKDKIHFDDREEAKAAL